MSGIEEVRGKRVLVRFEGRKCIHSRHCVLTHPDVFVPNVEGEWIHPDAVSSETVAALALACPSGAITYERLDGGEQESAPVVNLVRIRENGPLAIHAELTVDGVSAGFRATLCRCGASKHKPFCDMSHVEANFRASGEPDIQKSEPLEVRNGKLDVVPSKDGPLLLSGSMEIVSGTGRTVNRTVKAALCRCGQSSNKPYCDGTHRKVGFQS